MEKKPIIEAIENFLKMTEDFSTLGVLWSEKHPDCDIAKLRKEVLLLKTYLELEDVKEIEFDGNLLDGTLYRDSVGKYVAVMPCSDEYKNKTYLGVFVGEFPMGLSFRVSNNKFLVKASHKNPAIYIPELGKTIMGCESFWHEIENESQLKEITDNDINNVWYIQAMKQIEK